MQTNHLYETYMNFTTEIVTPIAARNYLASNIEGNRKINSNRVRFYAQQMLADQWHLSPQGLVFDTNGKLVDGQHRLAAIALAEKDVVMTIIRNAPIQSFSVLDSGMSRTLAFRANLSTTSAGIASGFLRFIDTNAANAVSLDDLLNVYEVFREEIDIINGTRRRAKVSIAPIMMATALHMKQGNYYAFDQYEAMVRFDTVVLTPCVANLMRSLMDGPLLSGSVVERSLAFMRVYKALMRANASKSKVVVRNEEGMKLELQQVIREFIATAPCLAKAA